MAHVAMAADSKKQYSGEACSDKEGSLYRQEAKRILLRYNSGVTVIYG